MVIASSVDRFHIYVMLKHLALATSLAFFLPLAIAAEPATGGTLTFPLATKVPGNPTVKVQVAWPRDANGVPTVEARDVVYYAPYWCEENFAAGGVFKALAEHFTVVGMFLDDRDAKGGDRRSIDPESGSFKAIEEALSETRTKLDLPPGKALACGHSSGATLIYWAARAHPEAFEAMAPIAGTVPPTTTPPAIPTLHVHTFGDGRVARAEAWHALTAETSLMLTTDPIWSQRDNAIWLHLNTSESVSLAVAWLRGVADVRRANAGVLPAMATWPVAMPAAQVAGTAEAQPIGVHHFPNQELATRFASVHRQIDRRVDAETGAQITTVTPRQGALRTVVVAIAPGRKADDAMYDAVLIAGKGATAIAVQGGTAATLAAVVATCTGPVAVIAPAAQADLLAALPAETMRLVLDPKGPVAPGQTAVVLAQATKGSAEVHQQQLLEAACLLVAHR